MKKLFAILLALMMVLSLAACGGDDDVCETHTDSNKDNVCDKCGWALGEVDTSQLKEGESEWNSEEYADYTNGIPEPEFSYMITGASAMMGMGINYNFEDAAELDTWKQTLLDSGFTVNYDEGGEEWSLVNDTHKITSVEGGAYIEIK